MEKLTMNCETATIVYSTSNPLDKIKELFPLAWDFLELQTINFRYGYTNQFDIAVQKLVGAKDYRYLTHHRENEDELSIQLQELIGDLTSKLLLQKYFSDLIEKQIFFGLLCCDGHITTDHELSLDEALEFQKAAIQIR
jgi:hypothetical protein